MNKFKATKTHTVLGTRRRNKAGAGRPKKVISEKQWARVFEALEVGMTRLEDLAGLVGCSNKRMRRSIMERDPRLLKKYEMDNKMGHITNIKEHERNWTASAWWLERKYPTEFGLTRQDPGDQKDKLIMTRKVIRKTITEEETSNGNSKADSESKE